LAELTALEEEHLYWDQEGNLWLLSDERVSVFDGFTLEMSYPGGSEYIGYAQSNTRKIFAFRQTFQSISIWSLR